MEAPAGTGLSVVLSTGTEGLLGEPPGGPECSEASHILFGLMIVNSGVIVHGAL